MKADTKNSVVIIGMLAILAIVSFLMFYGLAVQVLVSCTVIDVTTVRVITGVMGSAATVAFACLYFKDNAQTNGVQTIEK